MKINKLLFWIIVLCFITSCAVIHEQIKNVSQALTQSEKPSSLVETDKPSSPQSSQSGQSETVNFAFFAKKAKQGDAEAQYNLGSMYYNGQGVAKNDQEAVKWFQKAAEQGLAKAQFNLGTMYAGGYGVTKNDNEAIKWFRKAAKQGNAEAYSIWGWLLLSKGKFDEARAPIEKAYQLKPHNYVLILNLGHTYLLKANYQIARSYYQKALPLIPNSSFEQGPVANFQLFIQNGWQVKACKNELAWIRQAFEPFKLANNYDVQAMEYYKQGQFKQALPLAEKAYHIRKEMSGEKHFSTLITMNNLASIYGKLGKLSEALSLNEKSYRLSKEVLGEKHPHIITSLSNLALIYSDLGQLQKALSLSKKAYSLSKEVFGEKHPKMLISIGSLGFYYRELGRLSEALPLSKKAYSLSKEVFGEKHPKTLTLMSNLAYIYMELGSLSEALPLTEKAYSFRKEVLGEKHSDTIISISNLATVYMKLGRLSEALPLTEKAYSLNKELLGEKHPKMLTLLSNLSVVYTKLGRLSEALPLSEKAYSLNKEVVGEKHPQTLISINNLVFVYTKLGRLSEALPLSEKAYSLSKELLGEKHPKTLTLMSNLAQVYMDLGDLSAALPLFEKAYSLRKKVLGKKHPEIIDSLNHLAVIYNNLGRLSEALPLLKKSYSLSKELLGQKHPKTLSIMSNLAMFYMLSGGLSEALPLFEKSYRLRKEVLGEKHPDTFLSLYNLAQIYRNIGRLPEALSMVQKAYRFSKEALGEKHLQTINILFYLAIIYNELNDFSEALHLTEKVYSLSKEALGEKHHQTLSSLNRLARLYKQQDKINKAIKHFEKLVKDVEQLRSGDLSAENRQTLFKQWIPTYSILSYLYIKQSRFKDAFHLAELSKARTLLESLTAKRAAQESGLSKAEQQKLQDYEASLAYFNDQIGKATEANRLDDRVRLETDKNQLISELNQFERKLKAKYPKYAKLSEVQILSAKKGAKRLPKNAVLISYLVDGNEVMAFTIENNGRLTAHYLGEILNFTKDLESYRSGMAQGKARGRLVVRKKKENNKLSLELGKRLLAPLKDIIKDKTHWIISPSGALALIPFETLRLEGEKQPVIAQHQVSYVQSLSILAMLQKRDKAYKRIKNRGNLFAMGAPIYQKAGKVSKRTKPSSTDFKIARGLVQKNDSSRALRQLNLHWENLPGTLKELSVMKQVFIGAAVYKQNQATEAKLKSLNKQGILKAYRYLLFSAHGYLSPSVPALSSLVLGQVNNPKGIDGYVTAGEWPSYDLKSDLMVLSACETGLGEVVGGEGVLGLPYALFVAGNKNTLLTLWSISDEITTEFMASFFRKLKAGKGQIEALTATKREFLKKGGKYANPVYWAAFVLYGV